MELTTPLKKSYLAVGLSDEQIEGIAQHGRIQGFSPGEALVELGDTTSDLFVISEGRVNILNADGEKIHEVGEGSVLGEVSLIDAQPRTANAIAVGYVKAVVIPAPELRKYMNANRDTGFIVLANLARVLCGRLRTTNARIDALLEEGQDVWNHAL